MNVSTTERLLRYYPFGDDITENVSRAAHDQNSKDFTDLTAEYGIENGPEIIIPAGGSKPLEVLTFTPKTDHDESHARLYHLAMATSIDANRTMHAIRLFGADPTERLIVVGNPAGPGHGAGTVTMRQAFETVRKHDLRHFSQPALRYLGEVGISSADEIGYSYGADKALATSRLAPEYGIETPNGVFIESASSIKRNPLVLTHAFSRSLAPQRSYIDQTGSDAYINIHDTAGKAGLLMYAAGIARLSNIAIGCVLANSGYDERLEALAKEQPETAITVGWGSASELADDEVMAELTARLSGKYRNVRAMRLEGMHHAGDDDIDLSAAMVLQALRSPRP